MCVCVCGGGGGFFLLSLFEFEISLFTLDSNTYVTHKHIHLFISVYRFILFMLFNKCSVSYVTAAILLCPPFVCHGFKPW